MSDIDPDKTYKTKPFVDASISEIQTPGKYRIVGKIASYSEESIVIDDGFDQLTLSVPEDLNIKLKEGLKVRAFGYVTLQPEKSMNTNFLQDLEEIDLDVYRQINELEQSLRRANQ